MSLRKLYLISAIIPGAIAWLFGTAYTISLYQDYESEWITADFAMFMGIAEVTIVVAMLMGSCCTVFLNRRSWEGPNRSLFYLTWLVGPIIVMSFLGWSYLGNQQTSNSLFTFLVLPFALGIVYAYVRMTRENTANSA